MTLHPSPEPLAATVEALRRPFDLARAYEVGIEDEVMLLDPETFELADRATDVLEMVKGDSRFKLELPASQLEITTLPCASVGAAATALRDARLTLVAAGAGEVAYAGAGAHPFSSAIGKLNRGPRYDQIVHEYGAVARRQLVCALQVHVAVGDGDRCLAVYNAARSYLPLIAALAANAPFYEGIDTGLASVRPKVAELLPRQGIPPSFASWEQYRDALVWGSASGAPRDPAEWWWELRMHPKFGTLEFRVPDAQSTVDDAAAIAAVIQSLVAWLGSRHDAGETLGVESTWRIEENRWSACRRGVEGEMVVFPTGRRRHTRDVLVELLDLLQPSAATLGCQAEIGLARRLVEVNGALRQRQIARDGGVHEVARWLSQRFSGISAG